MSLTKKEQELLVEMFSKDRYKITVNGQKIYNSSWFFDVVSKLKKYGFLRSFKVNNSTGYQLTDEGIMLACMLNKALKKTEKDIFWIEVGSVENQ